MSLHFTRSTPKILLYTNGGMGEKLVDYLMDKVAILDHILEDMPHDGDMGQIKIFQDIVKAHGKYDIFFNLGSSHMFDYLALADDFAHRTFYIDVRGDIDTTPMGINNAEAIVDNTVEELWERCLVGATYE